MSRRPPSLSPTEAILDSISDGVFTVDLEGRVSSFNRAAERITGLKRAEAMGQPCQEVFRSSMCGEDCPLRRTLKTGKSIIGRSGFIIDQKGRRIPISVSTALLQDAEGRLLGGAETFRDLSEVECLRNELEGRLHIADLVSRSPLMHQVFAILPALAESPSTVLLTGETGTGKERIARAIHTLGPRSRGPFIALNCGALPDPLLESELFGYKAGAFTGANRDKAGRFALARGGSLFLDEIADISPALQVKLLRVLQERSFEPLGSTRSEGTDARILAATHRDLPDMVREGRFRQDLYYRLNVIRVDLPLLRKRMEDLPLMVEQFIQRFNQLQKKKVQGISAEALGLLMAHDWPGNVRELENVIERAFVLLRSGLISPAHLPEELHRKKAEAPTPDLDWRSSHQRLSAQVLREALEAHHGNRSAAARSLGIHSTTLYRRMKQLGLEAPFRDGRHGKP